MQTKVLNFKSQRKAGIQVLIMPRKISSKACHCANEKMQESPRTLVSPWQLEYRALKSLK